jgi:hypothetical protein
VNPCKRIPGDGDGDDALILTRLIWSGLVGRPQARLSRTERKTFRGPLTHPESHIETALKKGRLGITLPCPYQLPWGRALAGQH